MTSSYLPIIVFVLQILSVIHLSYTSRTSNSHIPAAFIELNIIVVINIIVLFLIYFLIPKFSFSSIWGGPYLLGLILLIVLLYKYFLMFKGDL
jgi:hypothetical protein